MGSCFMNLQDIYCCNRLHKGRVFNIPPTNKMQRVLVFLDECPICGQTRAIIKSVDFNKDIKVIVNRTGSKAVELMNKYKSCNTGLHKVEKGSKNNVGWFWFDGLKDFWVRDFNNKKIFKLFN